MRPQSVFLFEVLQCYTSVRFHRQYSKVVYDTYIKDEREINYFTTNNVNLPLFICMSVKRS